MSEAFSEPGMRMLGLVYAIKNHITDVRELHRGISGLEEGETHLPRRFSVYKDAVREATVPEHVEDAKERLGQMMDVLELLRGEAKYLQQQAGQDLGCSQLLQDIERLQEQYGEYRQNISEREPAAHNISAVSVKRAAPEKGREIGG